MTFRLFVFFSLLISLYSCQKEVQEKPVIMEMKTDTLHTITDDTKMVLITGGSFKPFFGSDTSIVKVETFMMDEHPVTNSEFLTFVKANPQWRKSMVKRLFADDSYLINWVSDTILPLNINPDAPVCSVSWFAAKAYSESVNKRLPTLDEWEYTARADEKLADARKVKDYSDRIIKLYMIKDRQFNPVKQHNPNYWGVYDMFDLIWEWTDDFNSVLSTGDSRESSYDNKGLFCAGSATSATDLMNYAAFMRFGFRTSLKANYTVSNLGFRCAKDITKTIQ